jgi:hypothetical protein
MMTCQHRYTFAASEIPQTQIMIFRATERTTLIDKDDLVNESRMPFQDQRTGGEPEIKWLDPHALLHGFELFEQDSDIF